VTVLRRAGAVRSPVASAVVTPAPDPYPPDDHLLRDLGLWMSWHAGPIVRGGIARSANVTNPSGSVVAGALSVLVDLVGGGAAFVASRPHGIATADMALHLTGRRAHGPIEAEARILRAGRSTVVAQADVRSGDELLARAGMTFMVMARPDDSAGPRPFGPDDEPSLAVDFAGPTGLPVPYREALGLVAVDRARGEVEIGVDEYLHNSFGALQGGAVVSLVDAAAESALTEACGAAVESLDLHITFLALGREGPVRSRASVLAAEPSWGAARVEVHDTGHDGRLMTVADVTAGLVTEGAGAERAGVAEVGA